MNAIPKGLDPAPEGAGPTVFVRTVAAPPGLPWDQARIAELDARAGAPLPITEVVYRLRRLEPWRPGSAARFAACYVRAREIGERLTATATVDGKPLAIEFVSSTLRARQAKRLATVAVAAAVTAVVAVGAVVTALSVRSDGETRLMTLQQTIDGRWRAARAAQHLRAQSRLLTAIHVRGQAVSDMLGDIAWVARTRNPAAHIDAVHWDHGYMGVESRGDAAPFGQTDRTVIKSDKPARPGVWLWGVSPAKRGQP